MPRRVWAGSHSGTWWAGLVRVCLWKREPLDFSAASSSRPGKETSVATAPSRDKLRNDFRGSSSGEMIGEIKWK